MFRLTGGQWTKRVEKTHRRHHHDAYCHASVFLCELHVGSSLRGRCFALCEQTTAENWQTTAAAIMRHLCVKRASVGLWELPSERTVVQRLPDTSHLNMSERKKMIPLSKSAPKVNEVCIEPKVLLHPSCTEDRLHSRFVQSC